jgi:hypothetical protein
MTTLDAVAAPHAVTNDSIIEVLTSTLFARLSSELEKKMKTMDFLFSYKNSGCSSRLCPLISPKLST